VPPPEDSPEKPWRTEGLPPKRPRTPDEVRRRRIVLWSAVIVLFVVNVVLVNVVFKPEEKPQPPTIPYNVFFREVGARNVASVVTSGSSIEGTFKEAVVVDGPDGPQEDMRFVTQRPSFAQDDVVQRMLDDGVTINATVPSANTRPFWASLILSVLPILLLVTLYVLIIRMFTGRAMGIGRSRARRYEPDTTNRVTFEDVAGIDEVRVELEEIVDMLRDPERYARLGASVPHGVLLAGAPGTGKTLLARAVAGEADVPFFSASASEFIEMVVGVGASRVRSLFSEARKVAPAIVFIDEIDAIGRARGGQRAGAVDEREQTLNQILTEMDGFTGHEGVIVLGATNRLDVLDAALLRPGRFDRRVAVNAPDQRGRAEILAIHSRDVPLADDVDLSTIASTTPGMVGADLENLVNEAALLAARRHRETVVRADFTEALEKVLLGAARHVVMPEAQRRRTAYHEAGHAIVAMLSEGADPVRKVSIIPRGQALGVTFQSPDEDRYGHTKSQLLALITGALGGRAAEEIVFGDVATGAESDLEFVARVTKMMVGRWGMSDAVGQLAVVPPPDVGFDGNLPSDELRRLVDDEARRIADECYARAKELLSGRREALESLAAALLEHETLDAEEVYEAAGLARRRPVLAEEQAVRGGDSAA
jgi:cell division protease FtsH